MSERSAESRFDEVVREVVEPVRRYLARRVETTTADDVLGEVLVVLWRRSEDVPLGEEVPWAIGVARLQLQNVLRSMRRQERLVAKIITVDPPPESVLEAEGVDPRASLVRGALAQLREVDAEVLRLRVWEELSVTEIADVLGMTPNAVSIRLHRAKKKLADRIRQTHAAAGHTAVREGDR